MSDELSNEQQIAVPSYLRSSGDNYGISTAADCYNSQSGPDCGTCQNGGESCGVSQYGPCSTCEGFECVSETCGQGCGQNCYENCYEGCDEGCNQGCSQGCDEGCGETCHEGDCGTCQLMVQVCGASQYGICDVCQGWSCETCEGDCQALTENDPCGNCEKGSQEGCTSICQFEAQGCLAKCEVQEEKPKEGVIDPWSWYSSNGYASDAQTQLAYEAVRNHGPVTDLNYVVWNDLVDKIYEAKSYEGYSWNAYYTTYASTRMSSNDKTLTAIRFNSARYNVGIHASTDVQEVATGDRVLGSYFAIVTSALNRYISAINEAAAQEE